MRKNAYYFIICLLILLFSNSFLYLLLLENTFNDSNLKPISSGKWSEPFLLSNISYQGGSIYIENDTMYSTKIFNISIPSEPREIGIFPQGEIKVSGDFFYRIGGSETGYFWVYNAENLTNVYLTSQLELYDTRFSEFVISDNIAYIYGNSKIYLINISENEEPGWDISSVHINTYEEPGWQIREIFYYDNKIFLSGWSGLYIINVTDPLNLSKLGYYGNESVGYRSLFIRNEIAYVCSLNYGLQIINISDVADPQLLGLFFEPGIQTLDVVVSNDIAYIKDLYDIIMVNVSDPSNPIKIRTILTEPTTGFYFQIYKDVLYVVNHEGLKIIDTGWDSDEDGIPDKTEEYIYNTDYQNNDTDFDLLTDFDEIMNYNTNPNSNDTDFDLLTDYDEIFVYGTNATNYDTDNDGLSDGEEILVYLTDPLNSDTDQDSITDGNDPLPLSFFIPTGLIITIFYAIFILIFCFLAYRNLKPIYLEKVRIRLKIKDFKEESLVIETIMDEQQFKKAKKLLENIIRKYKKYGIQKIPQEIKNLKISCDINYMVQQEYVENRDLFEKGKEIESFLSYSKLIKDIESKQKKKWINLILKEKLLEDFNHVKTNYLVKKENSWEKITILIDDLENLLSNKDFDSSRDNLSKAKSLYNQFKHDFVIENYLDFSILNAKIDSAEIEFKIYKRLLEYAKKYSRIHILEVISELDINMDLAEKIIIDLIQKGKISANFDEKSKGIEFNYASEEIDELLRIYRDWEKGGKKNS